MSTQHESSAGETPLDPESVAEFLSEHPGFFEERADLVARLRVPHPSGGAVSLVERQMSILRQQNRQLERKLVDLLEIARGNDALVEKMHRLTLALIEADDLESTVHTIQDQLRNTFNADFVAMYVFTAPPDADLPGPLRLVARDHPALDGFSGFLDSGRPLCGRLKPAQLEYLFGDDADAVASAALVALGEKPPLGMLGIGSRRKDAFTPAMSTLYLGRLGDLVGHALRHHS